MIWIIKSLIPYEWNKVVLIFVVQNGINFLYISKHINVHELSYTWDASGASKYQQIMHIYMHTYN